MKRRGMTNSIELTFVDRLSRRNIVRDQIRRMYILSERSPPTERVLREISMMISVLLIVASR